MTVLITGAGLIGRLTAQQLLEAGEDIVLADVVMPSRNDLSGSGSILPVVCDVSDFDAVRSLITEHHVTRIIHTAALLSTAIRERPLDGIRVNVMGTANLLECARTLPITRLVLASSTTVGYNCFASLGPEPLPEDAPMRMQSEQPGSIYASTKLAGEHLAGVYRSLYGVDAISLRYAAVLGGRPESPPTSVPGRLMHRLGEAGRTGHPLRLDDPYLLWGGAEEFIDARDCARANVCALRAPSPQQRVFNIATGQWVSMAEFVAAMRQVFPSLTVELPPEPATGFAGFPSRRPAPSDVRGAREQLGFSSQYSLAQTFAYWCKGDA